MNFLATLALVGAVMGATGLWRSLPTPPETPSPVPSRPPRRRTPPTAGERRTPPVSGRDGEPSPAARPGDTRRHGCVGTPWNRRRTRCGCPTWPPPWRSRNCWRTGVRPGPVPRGERT